MSNVKIGNKEMTVGDLVLGIAGLLLVIASFLTWTKLTLDSGWLGSETYNIGGFDLIGGKLNGNTAHYAFVAKVPLFCIIIGILAIAAAVVPMFVDANTGNILRIVGAVLALIVLIFMIIYLVKGGKADLFTGDDYNFVKEGIALGAVKMKLAFGAYLGLIASLGAVVGGVLNVLPIFKK